MTDESNSYQERFSILDERIDVLRHQALGIIRTARMGVPLQREKALEALDRSYKEVKRQFTELLDLAIQAGGSSGS